MVESFFRWMPLIQNERDSTALNYVLDRTVFQIRILYNEFIFKWSIQSTINDRWKNCLSRAWSSLLSQLLQSYSEVEISTSILYFKSFFDGRNYHTLYVVKQTSFRMRIWSWPLLFFSHYLSRVFLLFNQKCSCAVLIFFGHFLHKLVINTVRTHEYRCDISRFYRRFSHDFQNTASKRKSVDESKSAFSIN